MFHNTCHLKVLMIEHTIMTHILPIMYQCKAFSSQHLEMWWTCKAQKVSLILNTSGHFIKARGVIITF